MDRQTDGQRDGRKDGRMDGPKNATFLEMSFATKRNKLHRVDRLANSITESLPLTKGKNLPADKSRNNEAENTSGKKWRSGQNQNRENGRNGKMTKNNSRTSVGARK